VSGYTVYCHTNKHNGKKYVGVTKQSPYDRWQNGKHYKRHSRFWADIERYGWEDFTHEILFTGLSKEEASYQEKRLIDKWDLTNPEVGYNALQGGKIVETSESARVKLSEHNSGNRNPFFGKHHSAETKHLMESRKPKKKVVCIETGDVFSSTRNAERATGIGHSEIIKCCKGKSHTAGGYHWKYESEVSR
jgi:group I intron endonuclease